ncbi:MAG: alpha/beta fold hydrolase [Actinomycetota bacterium]
MTIFSHGITSSIDELRPLAAATPGTRILFDLRGHGRSESAACNYDHRAVRADIEFVAGHFNATRAFGVSVSAGALLSLLCDQPHRFEHIALFIPASIDEPNEAAISSFPAFAHELESISLEELAERYASESNDLFNRRPYWRALVRRRILNMNTTGVPSALRAYCDGPPPIEDRSLLENVIAPLLILGHEGDPIHDAEHARRLAKIFPNATAEVWPETLAMYDDLPGFSKLIGEFLGSDL